MEGGPDEVVECLYQFGEVIDFGLCLNVVVKWVELPIAVFVYFLNVASV